MLDVIYKMQFSVYRRFYSLKHFSKMITNSTLKLPILYGKAISPACRAVMITSKVVGIDLNFKIIDVSKQQHLDSNFLKLNPLHTIPTLDDNGFVIWDSHVISTYLINNYSKNDLLYPKHPQKRALVDLRLHFDNTTAMPSLINIVRPLKQKLFKSIPQDRINNANEIYRLLDLFLEKTTFVGGDDLSVADFHLITTVTSLDCLVAVDREFKNVVKWMEMCKQQPWYRENVNGLNDFKNLMRELQTNQ